MWKLLKYDVQSLKYYFIISGSILLFFLLLFLARTNDKNELFFLSVSIISLVGMFCYVFSFEKLFALRCVKDNLINYTSISKKTLLWEPLVFMVVYFSLYALLLFLTLMIAASVGGLDASKLPNSFMENTQNVYVIFLFYMMAMGVLFTLFTALSLSMWDLQRKISQKRGNHYELSSIGIIMTLIVTKIVEIIVVERTYVLMVDMILAIMLLIIHYVITIKKINS